MSFGIVFVGFEICNFGFIGFCFYLQVVCVCFFELCWLFGVARLRDCVVCVELWFLGGL